MKTLLITIAVIGCAVGCGPKEETVVQDPGARVAVSDPNMAALREQAKNFQVPNKGKKNDN